MTLCPARHDAAGRKCDTCGKPVKPFRLTVAIVPPAHIVRMGLDEERLEERLVYGTSLADAKARAKLD